VTRVFCDHCDSDITERKRGAVHGIAEANLEGDGVVSHRGDLCRKCYRELLAWLGEKRLAAQVARAAKKNRR
jgi:hypothetical protein